MNESERSLSVPGGYRRAVLVFLVCVSPLLPGVGCTRQAPVVAVDLVRERPEYVSPTMVIRGKDESQRQLLYGGFSVAENGLLMVPGNTPAVSFGFYLTKAEPTDVVFFGSAMPECQVALKVNGKAVGKMLISPQKQNYFVNVPAQFLKVGLNEGLLHFMCPPVDKKSLRAVFDSITVGRAGAPVRLATDPVPTVQQADGSEVSWLILPREDQLDFSCTLTAPEPAECEAEITLESDHLPRRTIWQSSLKVREQRVLSGVIDLSGVSGVPARITTVFRSRHPGARLSWNRLALKRLPPRTRPVMAARPSTTAPPNVIIFLVDTLRRDHLSLYGYKYPTSPQLASFGREAVVCDQAWSQCSWTSPTVASLFTGEYPSAHGVVTHEEQLHTDFTTIAEHLKARSYNTLAVVANTGIGDRRGYEQGFETFLYMQRKNAHELVDAAAPLLGKSPFFLYVHVMDSHYPYHVAEAPFDSLVRVPPGAVIRPKMLSMTKLRGGEYVPSEIELEYMRSVYDSEIAYVDHNFGRLVQLLKDRKLFDNTVIVFISDHGEEFNEHGSYYHGHTLFNEQTRVAMVIKPPAPFASSHLKEPVQTIDIYPTIASLAGAARPDLMGRDLTSALYDTTAGLDADYPVFSETDLQTDYRSVVIGRWKMIVMDRKLRGLADGLKLYDMSADTQERQNRIREEPIRGAYMATLIWRHQEQVAGKLKLSREELHKELDPDTIRQLEALGYLGGDGN